VVGVGLLKTTPALAARNQWLVRPPGANENDMLDNCIRCGQCLKVCPTGGLQPSLFTAGVDGLWTPVLVSRHGYCDYGCNSCGQTCPTNAIPRLELNQKRQMVMGVAVIDRNRCLPWAQGQTCIVCEEMCPVPNKAIRLNDIQVTDAQGQKTILRRPEVNDHDCIGCGACEYHCPIEGTAAIRVQRSPQAGQALQRGGRGGERDGGGGQGRERH
jgi:MauM/NapG family ferredoxin protein